MFEGTCKTSSNSCMAFRYPFLSKNGMALFSSKRVTALERTGLLNLEKGN